MNTIICGTRSANAEVRCIEDVIGYDGIDAFVERALALGQGVTEVDEEGAERFAQLFIGDYVPGTGRQSDDRLRQVYLPSGYVNVHVHDAITGKLLVAIYDSGRHPVRAISVAAAIASKGPTFRGPTVTMARHTQSELPGVLEIALWLSDL
jgi:hypothetical protein